MTISTNTNFFNQISSNIAKTNTTSTSSDSFTIHEETETEITAFTKRIEGDYSTYSAKDLSELSYDEVQENYKEIKEELEYRMKKAQDILNSESFKDYQKELVRNANFEIRGGSKEQSVMTEISFEESSNDISSFDSEGNPIYTNIEKSYANNKEFNEIEKLLNFNDKFKIVNFFDNDEINETIYTNYEDYSQVYYEDPDISHMDGSNGFNAGMAYSIQGSDLKSILESIAEAKEFIETNGVSANNSEDGSYSKGYLINGEEISIAGKIFSIYDVNKHLNKEVQVKKEDETQTVEESEKSSKTESEIPDYSSYTTEQLRQISFDEAKENYDKLVKVLENALKTTSDINKEDQDNLLAFKAQLKKIEYTKNDELNETIYNKLQDINDSKVAVWSDLVITENIQSFQDGQISSFVLGYCIFTKRHD